MGANFVTLQFNGNRTPAQLEGEVWDRIHRSRSEDGNDYSGEIGMATGLIVETEHFFNEDDAYAWLDEHCEKWEEARAVKYKRADGEPMWLVGAHCSS